jgi:hypothetical protein
LYKQYEPLDQQEDDHYLDTIEENLKALEHKDIQPTESEWL